MNRNPATRTNGAIRPEALRFIPAAKNRTRGTSCVKIAVYRLPGKGYNRLGESDAEPCTTSPFHLDLASPNKVNRGGLYT